MKQLIAGLVLGLGLLQGTQAATQTQTFEFVVPADSIGYSGSNSFAGFNSSLGTLTGIELSYNFLTHFSYSVTNNGASAINSVNLSAQDGYFSVGYFAGAPFPVFGQSGSITGSTSFFLAPGQTISDSGMAMPASAKSTDSMPLSDMMLPTLANGFTAYYQITTPYLAVGGRNSRLSVDATSQDLQGSISVSYIYAAVPVPEPESYAMFVAGLGLIGAMVRRRKTL